jgi:hypothetical protein
MHYSAINKQGKTLATVKAALKSDAKAALEVILKSKQYRREWMVVSNFNMR